MATSSIPRPGSSGPSTASTKHGTPRAFTYRADVAAGLGNMTVRMLIDATHAEETRVVVVRGNRLEAFDFESASRRQLKGNIYLAKVMRVEPSLQAAFVEYGGNRHGFLAFNEIHPDYYQIPVEDREALLEEEAQNASEEAAAEEAEVIAEGAGQASDETETGSDEAPATASGDDGGDGDSDSDDGDGGDDGGDGDALDEVPRRRPQRRYKIQEVVKRRQVLLVQVVKEERGNKGAALTTYLSLAGRYCVLMPNTARGGGISRKITNQVARKKLKNIVADFELAEGMGVIVRTAGMSRTKAEIRRDFEYMLRVWDQVREVTLESTAPALVYEEANLITRTIRDLYTKEVEEILVEGEMGYRTAKDFMRTMQPSHAKRVQHYKDRIPLLHRYKVEQQLDQMHSNVVQLKSGGYLVINPTEALVAIDVNSGRSTREHHIEETALKTNLEASDEVARQLRLRDLAGLIVIDYIDMSENRNNRAVERRLKDGLKVDRARLQVGRISGFGLLEMSRQRLRTSLFEASTVKCKICAGTGFVRSTESTAFQLLRAIEDEGVRGRANSITLTVPTAVALYVLNQKRDALAEIEQRYVIRVAVVGDDDLVPPNFELVIDVARGDGGAEADGAVTAPREPEKEAEVEVEAEADGRKRRRRPSEEDETEVTRESSRAEAPAEAEKQAESEGDGRKRRRRRPRRAEGEGAEAKESMAGVESAEKTEAAAEDGEDGGTRRRRRRGRRGGKRRRDGQGEDAAVETAKTADEAAPEADDVPAQDAVALPRDVAVEAEEEAAPVDAAAIVAAAAKPVVEAPLGQASEETEENAAVEVAEAVPDVADVAGVADAEETEEAEEAEEAQPEPAPLAASDDDAPPMGEPEGEASVVAIEEPEDRDEPAADEAPDDDRPKRRGWWRKKNG